MSHTNRIRTLKLPFVYGDYTATDNFRHIGTGIYGYDKDTCRNKGQCVAVVHKGISPEYNHCLNHHRRSSENFHVYADYRIYDFQKKPDKRIFGLGDCPYDAGYESDCKSDYCSCQGDEHCISHATQ